MSQSEFGGAKLVGCCLRGPSHEKDGTPCQDAYHAERLPGGRFVAAVGDGLGSAEKSHVGSEVATSHAATALREYLEGAATIDRDAAERAVRDAVTTAREALFERAEEDDVAVNELATTLLVVVAGPSGVAGGIAGDGGIVVRADENETAEKFLPKEDEVVDLEYNSLTVPLSNSRWEDSYRFAYRADVTDVAVFSDGIEEFAWEGHDLSDGYFENFFDFLQSNDDMDAVINEVVSTLDNEHYRRYSADDKTLVVGIVPDSGPSIRDRLRRAQDAAAAVRGKVGFSSPRTPDAFESGTVETTDGEELSVGQLLSEGVDGNVYRLTDSTTEAVKILPADRRVDADIPRKIETMTAVRPSAAGESFAWPTEVIQSVPEGRFLGYRFSAPDVSVEDIGSFARSTSTTRSSQGVLWELLRLFPGVNAGILSTGTAHSESYEVAYQLATAVDALHEAGHALGPVAQSEVVVKSDGVLLTDCDSYHIGVPDGESYAPKSYFPRTAPPEGIGDTLATTRRGDRFTLAVLVFELVMAGHHPFLADGSEAVTGDFTEVVGANPFPYRDPRSGKLEPPDGAPDYATLPSSLQEMFEKCFVEGKTTPELRPPVSQWVETLERLQ